MPEADDYLNDLNRQMIDAMKAKHGRVWLVRDLNAKGPILVEYVGQKVYNFGCDAVIPCDDAELVRLIKERDDTPSAGYSMRDDEKRIKAIQKRLAELGSEIFIWS